MPTMQFTLSSFTNKNADLKAGNTFTAYASGDGISTAMILAARITLNNIRAYSTQCYLDMIKGGGTGKTAVLGQNANIHNQTVSLVEFTHALIQTGAGTESFTIRASAGSTGNLLNLRDNVSGVLEIDYFIPQSDYSLDKAEVIAGEVITATISPTHPNAEHETTWRFQTQYQNFQAAHYASAHHSAPFNEALTVPLDWLKAIPDKESGTASITVDTYMNGVKTGTVVKYFSIKAGPGVIPGLNTLNLAAARINHGVPDTWGLYVQGISGVRLTGSGIAGIYDSWITEVKITGAGYEGAGSPYDTGPVNAAGNVAFVCEITDSRGKKNTASVSVAFVAYSTPQMLDLDVVRCLSDGTPDNSGEHVLITPAYAINSVNGHNALTSMVTSKRLYAGGDYGQISTQAVASGQSFTVGGFDQNIHYVVKVVIADTFSTAETVVLVPAQQFLLHYRYGGRGVAIGMIAQRENAFEVNPEWEIFYKGQTLDQRFGGIDIPNIWPVTSGGTGLDSIPGGNYLMGNGVGALIPRTPAQVLADIGAAASGHNHTLDNLDGTLAVAKGGTGGVTAATARSNLGITPLNIGAVAKKAYASEAELNAEMQDSFYRRTDFLQIGFTGIFDSGYRFQLIHNYGTNNLYFRHTASAGWNPSRRLFHDGDTIGIINGGTGATTAAAARNNLGITPDNLNIDWKTVYNHVDGCLVETSLLTTESNMFFLEIRGNGYGQGKVIDIKLQGYYFQPGDTFYNLKAIGGDLVIPIRVFKYNGKVYFWFKQPTDYITFWVYLRAWNTTENRITAITWAAMPTSGVTLDNTIVPAQVFNSSEGNIVPVANGGTGASTGANACANIGAMKKTGDTMTGLLQLIVNGYYTLMGSQGYGYSHYSTDAPNGHWFNASLKCQGEIYAGPSYDKRVYHTGNIKNGQSGPPETGVAEGDIYLQW